MTIKTSTLVLLVKRSADRKREKAKGEESSTQESPEPSDMEFKEPTIVEGKRPSRSYDFTAPAGTSLRQMNFPPPTITARRPEEINFDEGENFVSRRPGPRRRARPRPSMADIGREFDGGAASVLKDVAPGAGMGGIGREFDGGAAGVLDELSNPRTPARAVPRPKPGLAALKGRSFADIGSEGEDWGAL